LRVVADERRVEQRVVESQVLRGCQIGCGLRSHERTLACDELAGLLDLTDGAAHDEQADGHERHRQQHHADHRCTALR
jgi:hypothetical protein